MESAAPFATNLPVPGLGQLGKRDSCDCGALYSFTDSATSSRNRIEEMAENKTADQVRDEHLRTLGPPLGPLYDALYNEVVWLHAKWNQYRILYAESPKRLELLNRTAGFFPDDSECPLRGRSDAHRAID